MFRPCPFAITFDASMSKATNRATPWAPTAASRGWPYGLLWPAVSNGPNPGAAAREPRATGAANRPHFAGKPSPGLRGGGIQCCVRVQAGPPRAGARERVRASPRPADAGAAHRAVAPRARRLERGPALAAGATRRHSSLPSYLELG